MIQEFSKRVNVHHLPFNAPLTQRNSSGSSVALEEHWRRIRQYENLVLKIQSVNRSSQRIAESLVSSSNGLAFKERLVPQSQINLMSSTLGSQSVRTS